MHDEPASIPLSGATRLHLILGDPIAQVKSPAGVTRSFHRRGRDAILVPVQVAIEHLTMFLETATALKNLDGIIVTVPHKFGCYRHCASASERSAFLGTVNVMRRRPEGGWHGDIVDGLGFVGAARKHGRDPAGQRALLIGAGGAGSAIALALVDAGVRELAIHDEDSTRRDALIARLNSLGRAHVFAGSPDPTGFSFVGNATPVGMRPDDPLPLEADKLSPSAYVGCVITSPAVSPLIVAARARGCATGVGTDMYEALQEKMVDFLLFADERAK